MTSPTQLQDEIDGNYEVFCALLPKLIQTDAGKWALLRHAEVEAIFDTPRDAQLAGEKLFHDRLFSVEQVTDRAIDLGWFSHAVSQRNV